MVRSARTAWLVTLPFLVACGSDPLAATWTTQSTTMSGTNQTIAMTLGADGAVSIAVTPTTFGSSHCTGSLQYTGMSWTSTEQVITFGGNALCTGSVTCHATTDLVLDCSNGTPTGVPGLGDCHYTLSADGNTLSLVACPGFGRGTTAYTRGM